MPTFTSTGNITYPGVQRWIVPQSLYIYPANSTAVTYVTVSTGSWTQAQFPYQLSAATYLNQEPVVTFPQTGQWRRQQREAQAPPRQVPPETTHRLSRLTILRREADKRARALLLLHLTLEQREEFRQSQYFRIPSALFPGREYRIYLGWAGNIYLCDHGKHAAHERLCIHPAIEVPYEDNMLAQKLMIEANENLFRETANITPLARVA